MNVNGSHLLERFWVLFCLFACLFVHGFLQSGIREGYGCAAWACCPFSVSTTWNYYYFVLVLSIFVVPVMLCGS